MATKLPALLIGCLLIASTAFAQDPGIVEQSCPPGGDCGSPRAGMRYLAFEKVLNARSLLGDHDTCMNVLKSTEFNDHVFEGQVNYLRSEVLDMAIQAYYLCGPIHYSSDGPELMEEIQNPDHKFPVYQWPSSLDDLVSSGLLDKLPESPYGPSRYFSEVLEDGGMPGDVVYQAYPTEVKGTFLLEPGGLENFIFYILGRPGTFVIPPEELRDSFLGNLEDVLPNPPENIVYLVGQKYKEDVEEEPTAD